MKKDKKTAPELAEFAEAARALAEVAGAAARPDLSQAAEAVEAAAGALAEALAARPDLARALAAQVAEINEAAGKIIAEAACEAISSLYGFQPHGGAVDFLAWFSDILDRIDTAGPYLEKELKKPEYGGKSIAALYNEAARDTDGHPAPDSLFLKAIDAAEAAAIKEKPERAAITRAQSIEYPLDKPNSLIWSLLEKDTAGQIEFNLAKFGSKKTIPAYYAIDFDALGDSVTITKRLLPFDKRVYIAISALFNAGNNVITLSQIYRAMGNTSRPAIDQLERINEAITKMTGARIHFDNEAEANAYKYARFKYDGSLLPLERAAAIVNGQLADAAIHIFREPPLISFAKKRQQITTIDVKLLQSPISKTDDNLLIDDYLLERISKEKRKKNNKSCRILYATLYDRVGIPSNPKTDAQRKKKKRAPEKIKKYLTHYKTQNFISGFTMENDGITISWN